MQLQAEIWKWVQNLPPWQSDLVRRLCGNTALGETAVDEVLRMVLAVHGLDDPNNPAVAPVRATFEDIPADALLTGSPRIIELSGISGVGALDAGQKLEFAATGLTVVYGDNATGKSSYARVLKKACRASDAASQILPNVFEKVKVEGQALIRFEQAGNTLDIQRSVNTKPEPILSAISVFDTQCARIYADSENEIAYVPSGLSLFERLGKLQDHLRALVQARPQMLQGPPDITEFASGTAVAAAIAALSADTDPVVLETLAGMTPQDNARLDDLEILRASWIATDHQRQADDARRKAAAARNLKTHLEALDNVLGAGSVDQLREADASAQAAAAAFQLASHDAFRSEPVQGVGSDPWHILWNAAREYSEQVAYPGRPFPVLEDEANCVLCHQALGGEAQERMRRFEAFVCDTAADVARQRQAELAILLGRLDSVPLAPDLVQPGLMSPAHLLFDADAPELAVAVTAVVAAAAVRLGAIRLACQTHDWTGMPPLPPCPEREIENWALHMDRTSSDLERLAIPVERTRLETELAELKARRQLQRRLPELLAWIRVTRDRRCLTKANTALATASITNKSNLLSAELVTTRLRNSLSVELAALRCDYLRVKMDSRGVKGRTNVKLALDAPDGAKVLEVLSEGEQRAVALAFFLAEIGAADHDGGILLDDPVSSLDHFRRSYVVKRLVEESARRQVIVFTHDLLFLFELQAAATRHSQPCVTWTVRRASGRVGVASKDLPWLALNVKSRVGILRNDLQALRKLEQGDDEDAYRKQVKLWFEQLREAWERAVEERLFQDTVRRFRHSVETQRLESVKKVFTVQLVQDVIDEMTISSAWIHDQAAGVTREVPTGRELEERLAKLDDLIKKTQV